MRRTQPSHKIKQAAAAVAGVSDLMHAKVVEHCLIWGGPMHWPDSGSRKIGTKHSWKLQLLLLLLSVCQSSSTRRACTHAEGVPEDSLP